MGVPLGHAIGGAANYVAAGVIVVLGVYVFFDQENEADRPLLLTKRGALGAVVLGVSVSLDERR